MQDYFEYAQSVFGQQPSMPESEKTCPTEAMINAPSYAMAYVPVQPYCDIYDEQKGYDAGTIFKLLDKPFEGAKF